MVGGSRALASALALAALLVGGCSSDDDDAAKPKGDEPAAADDVAAQPSAGCGTSTVAEGEEKVRTQSGGVERWYFRHVPPAHDGEEPLPLVLDLHGYSEGADIHRQNSQLGTYGDDQGFVTLTPQGHGDVTFWDTAPGTADVAYVGDLLDEAERTLCIDTARVYVTGLSNGAMMTSTVACVYADRIAAAAPVAGVTQVSGCTPDRAVPAVAFHGTEDPFLKYEGGFGDAVNSLSLPDGSGTIGDAAATGSTLPDVGNSASIPETMAIWAARNGCADMPPAEAEVADDVVVLSYDCEDEAAVELYRVDGGGHTWPGSHFLEGVALVGKTTFSISANEVMWEFFQDHPLRSS